jgi:hypothetical protein
MKKITRNTNDLEITVTARQDHIPVRGNAMASGDDALDKQVEDEIIARLNSGDVWAWASVCVKVTYLGLEAEEYLGGCCYEGENDFIKNSGYYDDMVAAAIDDLNRQAQQMKAALCDE